MNSKFKAPSVAGLVISLCCFSTGFVHQHAVAFSSVRLPGYVNRRASGPGQLYASQKKKSGQEKARAKTEEELRLRKMRRELESSLQDILDDRKAAGKAKAVRKLLRGAAHDGLPDVGDTARTLAIKCLAAVGRYDEIVPLLAALESSDTSAIEDDLDMVRIGLRAFAEAEDWDKAASYADVLFGDDRSTDKTAANEESALTFAIQAYGNTGQNLDKAEKLMQRSADLGKLSSADVSIILKAVVQSGKYDEARELYDVYEDIGYNQKTYKLAIHIASKLGDLQLAKTAFYGLKSANALNMVDVAACMESYSHSSNTNANFVNEVLFATELVGELNRHKQSLGKVRAQIPRAFLSSLLENIADTDATIDIRRDVFEASKLFQGKWPDWLSERARVRAFPAVDNDDDAEKLLTSFPFSHDMVKAIQVVGASSSSFWSAYLRFCARPIVAHVMENEEFPKHRLGFIKFGADIVANKEIDLEQNEGTILAKLAIMYDITATSSHAEPAQQDSIVNSSLLEIDSTFKHAAEAGMMCSPSFFFAAAEFHLGIQAIGGRVDSINRDYSHWINFFDLRDRENFQLSFRRYDCLADAYYIKKEYAKLGGLLFPSYFSGKVPSRNKTLPFPYSLSFGNSTSNGDLSTSNEDDIALLRGVADGAIVCDAAAGNNECTEALAKDYRNLLHGLWRHRDFVMSWLKDFAPRSDMNSLEDDILGEPYTGFVLDLLEETDCMEHWMTTSVKESCASVSILYTGQFFHQSEFADRIKRLRKACVTKLTDKIFAQVESDLQDERKQGNFPTSPFTGTDATITDWTFCAMHIYPRFASALSADMNDSDKEEALDIAYKALLNQPLVQSIQRSLLVREFERRKGKIGR